MTGRKELTNEQLPTASYFWRHLKSTHMKCRVQAVPLQRWSTRCPVESPDAVGRAVRDGGTGRWGGGELGRCLSSSCAVIPGKGGHQRYIMRHKNSGPVRSTTVLPLPLFRLGWHPVCLAHIVLKLWTECRDPCPAHPGSSLPLPVPALGRFEAGDEWGHTPLSLALFKVLCSFTYSMSGSRSV